MDFANINSNDEKMLTAELLNKKEITLKTEYKTHEIQKLLCLQFVSDSLKKRKLDNTSKSMNAIIKTFSEMRVSMNRQGRKEFAEMLKREIEFNRQVDPLKGMIK